MFTFTRKNTIFIHNNFHIFLFHLFKINYQSVCGIKQRYFIQWSLLQHLPDDKQNNNHTNKALKLNSIVRSERLFLT